MSEPLDELYLVWLYGQVSNTRLRSPRKTYWNLLRSIFTTQFFWFVPNDDARVDDGLELRIEFLQEAEIPEVDPLWLHQGCSFLEMLIGLSRRLAFQADNTPAYWFWELISNLGLSEYNDASQSNVSDVVAEVTNRVTFRTYNYSGEGGLFPLKYPPKNQREVELWFQMQYYLMELEGG